MSPSTLVVSVAGVAAITLFGACSPSRGDTASDTASDTAPGSTSAATGVGQVLTDLPEPDVDYVDAVPSTDLYDGLFQYQLAAVIDEQTWQPRADLSPFLWAGFQSPGVRILSLPYDSDGIDTCTHVFYGRVSTTGLFHNLDVGDFLGVSVGDDVLRMKREGADSDDTTPDIDYWFDPDTSPPGFAAQTGAEISLDDVNTGLVVPQPLELVDFGTTWLTYLSTGRLVLWWVPQQDLVPGGSVSVSIFADDQVAYRAEAVDCALEDDGYAVIDAPFDTAVWSLHLGVAHQQDLDLDHPDLGHLQVRALRDLQIEVAATGG